MSCLKPICVLDKKWALYAKLSFPHIRNVKASLKTQKGTLYYTMSLSAFLTIQFVF